MPRILQSIIREVQSRSLNFFYLPIINDVVFPCVSFVHSLKKVLKLHTTGSKDCYYTGIVKNQ